MPEANNEVDLSTVGDVVLHLYYTAMDGGGNLKQAAQANNAANLPTSGLKLFSAQNDFAAATPTNANPYPQTPWANPSWPRQHRASQPDAHAEHLADEVPALDARQDDLGDLDHRPHGRLATGTIRARAASAVTDRHDQHDPGRGGERAAHLHGDDHARGWDARSGTWSFELQQQGAPDFRSLTKSEIGDVVLLISYSGG